MELWTMRIPETGTAVIQAERAERAGWDGITFTDSQNLSATRSSRSHWRAQATERLAVRDRGRQRVHPPPGRAGDRRRDGAGGVGRPLRARDRPRRHRAVPPRSEADEGRRRSRAAVTDLQTYLGSGTIDCDGHPSRIQWLDRARQPKVPLDIAVSGPRMIELAAGLAERVTLAVGADPERVAWAIDLARAAAVAAGRDPASISFGAYVNVGCHPDLDAARGTDQWRRRRVRALLVDAGLDRRGPRPDADRAVVAEVGRRYDSNVHLRNRAEHTGALTPEFVDRFAVVGPPEGVRRPAPGARRPRARAVRHHRRELRRRPGATRVAADQLLTGEVLPGIREGASVMSEHELIIRGGTVVDGTGARARDGGRRDRRRRRHRGRRRRRSGRPDASTPTGCW